MYKYLNDGFLYRKMYFQIICTDILNIHRITKKINLKNNIIRLFNFGRRSQGKKSKIFIVKFFFLSFCLSFLHGVFSEAVISHV